MKCSFLNNQGCADDPAVLVMGNADKAVVKSSSKGFRYKFRSEGYLYEESLAPNHVHLWLALSLPSVALDRSSRPLKLNIPDTLVYGFGKNPVWLYTDDNGFVNKYICNVTVLLPS